MNSVIMTGYPADKIVSIIKVVKKITGMPLVPAKVIVQGPMPVTVKDDIADAAEAEDIKRQLEAVGATVQLHSEPAHGVMSAKSIGQEILEAVSRSIEGTSLEEAIEEQRDALFDVQAIIDVVAHSLDSAPDSDDAGKPCYFRTLRQASKLLNDIAGAMETVCLESRALVILQEKRAQSQEVCHG